MVPVEHIKAGIGLRPRTPFRTAGTVDIHLKSQHWHYSERTMKASQIVLKMGPKFRASQPIIVSFDNFQFDFRPEFQVVYDTKYFQ